MNQSVTFLQTVTAIRRLYGFLKGQSVLYGIGLVLTSSYFLLASLFEGQLYAVVAAAAETGMSQISLRFLRVFLLLLLLVILRAVGMVLYQRATARGDEALRKELGKRLIRMPLVLWQQRHSGDWISILGKDTDDATNTYKEKAMNLTGCLLQSVGGFIILVSVSPVMAAWGLAAGLGYMWIGLLTWKRMRRFQQRVRTAGGESAVQLSNQISGQLISRFYHMQDVLSGKLDQALSHAVESGMSGARIAVLNGALVQIGYTLAYSGALVVGLILVKRGSITLPEMLSMWPLSMGIAYGFQQLGFLFTEFQETAAAVERLEEVLNLPQEDLAELPAAEQERGIPAVSLERLSFSYTEEQRVLDELSLTIFAGEKVAFVGESGCGKTTLMKLLMGFYQPESGTIKIFGIRPEGRGLTAARSFFSYVPQMPHLLDDTIHQNIAIVKSGASNEEIVRAATLAEADAFICRLPDGYQTMAGEHGNHLSGGQKQRVAIARAFLHDAPIMLFDEATAALDGQSEERIHQVLRQIGREKTLLLITHRLSTATLADRIIVLKQGKAVECGSHEELLAKQGYYWKLWKAAGF